MAYYLTHNHDTSSKTLVNLLNRELKKIPNLNNSPTLNLCQDDKNIVSLSPHGVAQDIDNLIKRLNDDGDDKLLPQVIVAIANNIKASDFGNAFKKFKRRDGIEIVDSKDPQNKIKLAGQIFDYETPIQIVILTRSQYDAKELSLHLLNILANNSKIYYKVRLYDTDNPDKFFSVDNYGHIKLIGVQSAVFSESTTQEQGMIALGMEIAMREQFFMFKDYENILKKWEINHKAL